MSKRAHKPTAPKATRHLLASAMLLLSCLPLWGNDGPELEIDPARSTFRVVGASPQEMPVGGWRKPPLILRGHENGVSAVSLSANGRIALSGDRDGIVRVWDTTTAKLLHAMAGHEGGIADVSLSADGRLALSASSKGIMRMWDTSTGKLLQTIKGHEGTIAAVSLSADGRIALSGGGDGIVRVWDTTTVKLLHAMEGHEAGITDVSLSADGNIALSADGKTARVWDARAGEFMHAMEGRRDSNLSARVGEFMRDIEGWRDPTLSVALSADGRIALSGSWGIYLGDGVGYAYSWNVATGAWLSTMDHTYFNLSYKKPVHNVSLNADGRLALSATWDSSAMLLWDTAKGDLLRTLDGHKYSVDATPLVMGKRIERLEVDDGTVYLWDAATDRLLHTMRGHSESINAVSLSADGRTALSGGGDGTVRAWKFPLTHPQPALRQAAERYALQTPQALRARIGPAIPAPALPPLLPPVREHEHGPSETKTTFERRMARARAERKRQIGDIEADYRTAVKKRNAKLRRFKKKPFPHIRLSAYARAVAEVLGHPMLVARYTGYPGEPAYEPEATPPRMHVALQFEHTSTSQGWIFEVPHGDPAREFFAALEAGTVSTTTEYRLQDDTLLLVAVHAHHGDVQYKGTPGDQDKDSASQGEVPVLEQLSLLKPQDPALKDAPFKQYEARQRAKFAADPEAP